VVEDKLVASTPQEVAQVLGLPSARKCISRRTIPIKVKQPKDLVIKTVQITLNGKKLRVRKVRGRFTTVADLRGLPKGQFTVKIVVTTPNGKKIRGARKYKTCTRRERGSNRSPV
jgi:hypothetical protein